MYTGLLLLFYTITTDACLPGPFGLGGYSPGFATGYGAYNPLIPPVVPPFVPRMGPFRSQQQEPQQHQPQLVQQHPSLQPPHIQAQYDEVHSVSALNCPTFADNCKWGNTPDEELDWTMIRSSPEAQRYLTTLNVQNLPDYSAGALVSVSRRGWEGGQLISDPLPCLSDGIKLTATAYRSRNGPTSEQPKLQVCSKNVHEVKFPLVNCNPFEIRNGVPISVPVPLPNDPRSPSQIVIYGNNFVGMDGGAIFLQDIVVEGNLNCDGSTFISDNRDISTNFINDGQTRSNLRSPQDNVGPLRMVEGLPDLEPIDAAPKSPFDDKVAAQPMLPSVFPSSGINQASPLPAPLIANQAASQNSISSPSSLFESCLALSCNPSDLSCTFWRSKDNNRWEIGTSGRISNPLTGIHLPPGTAQKFLVAPFLDQHIKSYTLVSQSLTVPAQEDVYFCFYEYYATHGLSLSICTDKHECFYKKDSLAMGNGIEENKRWNIRCSKLPIGSYELRVIATNDGENRGEVGFLPIRLSKNADGSQFIC